MEYVAFLFLGLGIMLVLAGVLLQVNEKRRSGSASFEDYLHKSPARRMESASPVTGMASIAQTHAPELALAGAAVGSASVPGPFQFVQDEPAPAAQAPQPTPVAVSVQKSNPRLFEKFAYLYLDSSQRNVYDGAGSAVAFDLSEVSGIRRFGRGVFSYDGFGFYFDHASGQERFPLGNLKTVGFYPNCVALTFRTHQPVALLFMEETETIRRVLETFRVQQAP